MKEESYCVLLDRALPNGLFELIRHRLYTEVDDDMDVRRYHKAEPVDEPIYTGMFGNVRPRTREAIIAILNETSELWRCACSALKLARRKPTARDRVTRPRDKRVVALLELMVAAGCGIAVKSGPGHPGDLRIGPMSLVTPAMRAEIGLLAFELIEVAHPPSERRNCVECAVSRQRTTQRFKTPPSEAI